ncbi:MAG: ketopantoate reductase family protein [Clostridia bacterium]|nr:ketopantoate reductase family protein [Clostridia bacterium]
MNIVLVGAGSIGGTVAVLLKEHGYDLDVVAHEEEKARLFREEGFRLTGVYGDHCEKLNAYPDVSSLTKQYDLALIATKYQQMPKVARELLPHLNEDALVASLQNGLVLDLLAPIVGEERTVGVMIGIGATQLEANLVNITAVAELVVGMKDGSEPEKLKALARMLNEGLPTHTTTDITGKLFSKMIFNSVINSMASVTNGPVGHMMKKAKARRIVLAIIREGMAVADAMGVEVPRFNIMPSWRFIANRKTRLSRWCTGQALRLMLFAGSGKVRPSTLQSLEKGKPTEIDIMNGYTSAKGKEYGVPTPVNDSLTAVIKEIESGARPLTKKNLKAVQEK